MVVVAKFWWKMVMWVYEREKERERERERFFFFIWLCSLYNFFELYVKIRIEMLGALLKRLIKKIK